MNSSSRESSRKNPLILNPAIFALFGSKITDKSLSEKAEKMEKIKTVLKQQAKDIIKREKAVANAEKRVETLKTKQKALEEEIKNQQQMHSILKKDHSKTFSEMQGFQKTSESQKQELKSTEKSAKSALRELKKRQNLLAAHEDAVQERERELIAKEKKLINLIDRSKPLENRNAKLKSEIDAKEFRLAQLKKEAKSHVSARDTELKRQRRS